jgi:hypothetical protein
MITTSERGASGWIAALLTLCVACGGDDGGGSGSLSAGGSGGSADSGESSDAGASSESSGGTSSGSSEGSSTAAVDGSSSDDAAGSTGAPGDPSYPEPGTAGCRDGAVLDLQGVAVCAPFCPGPGGACPAPGSGDATPVCTPFEMEGGSGTACRDDGDCSGDEACGVGGTCIAVAFWGCRLSCAAGETCPDAMTCAAPGSCGYPQ